MEQKTSEFDKVLGAWDILVIAFGAMIGWGWVVSSGNWIESGGVLGAASVIVQWVRQVLLSVPGQSFLDM